MGAASGGHDPTTAAGAAVLPVGMTAAPAVSAIHHELLAPLTGSRPAHQGVHSSVAARGGVPANGAAARGLGGATGVNSGSPVRLPSLESSPVPMQSGDVEGSTIEHVAGRGGSVNKIAVGLGPGSNKDHGRGPVLIGQGGRQWGGKLAASGGTAAGRWPARHKFSMKRTRQRSEKLQPVGAGIAEDGTLSTAGVAADGAVSVGVVESSIDNRDYLDNEADRGIDQAW